MVDSGYSRRDNTQRDIQPAAVMSVDTVKRTASMATRQRTLIDVDISFAVGESIVTPATGEQWYIERFDAVWRLYGRIPFNDPTLLIEAVEGQVSVGSATGPTELNGTAINFRAPVNLQQTSTDARPDPVTAGMGAMVYDSTLGHPIYSNGTAWTDALGTVV
jgi:hypothetical protein